MSKKTISIIGAFDRSNYGDLLFPLIIKEKLSELNNREDLSFKYHGIIQSDLSKLGALPTANYKEFCRDCNSIENIIIIVAGGEVLSATWLVLLSFLNKTNDWLYRLNNKFFKGIFDSIINHLIQWYYRSNSKFPFVVGKRHFKKTPKIIYNSVGGLRDADIFMKYHRYYHVLKDSDFFSVRDRQSFLLFQSFNIPVNLNPDSAILISDIYPKESLLNKTSNSFKELGSEFIFFQINKHYGLQNQEQIIAQLTNLHHKYELDIVLCPIGKAFGHEDQIPLSLIHEKLQFINIFVDSPSIWDIMYLIAKSKLYIGSSLHGIITAMSYSVPYLGIGYKTSKLDSYLNTWGVSTLDHSIAIEEITAKVDNALYYSMDLLKQNKEHQIGLANNSFMVMNSIINN